MRAVGNGDIETPATYAVNSLSSGEGAGGRASGDFDFPHLGLPCQNDSTENSEAPQIKRRSTLIGHLPF